MNLNSLLAEKMSVCRRISLPLNSVGNLNASTLEMKSDIPPFSH